MRESLRALKWALHSLCRMANIHLVLLHIELPLRYIPSPVGNFPIDTVDESIRETYKIERRIALRESFSKYLGFCNEANVKATPLLVEKAEVASGLVNAVTELSIRKLIVGSTSVGCISKKMRFQGVSVTDYLKKYAPKWCDIAIVGGKSVEIVSGAGNPQSKKRPARADNELDDMRRSGCSSPLGFFDGIPRHSDVSAGMSLSSSTSSEMQTAGIGSDLKEKLRLSETEDQSYNAKTMYNNRHSSPRDFRERVTIQGRTPLVENVNFDLTKASQELEETRRVLERERERRLSAESEAFDYMKKAKEWKRKARANESLLRLTKELLDNSKRQIDERDKTVLALQNRLSETSSQLRTVTVALGEERLRNSALMEQNDIIVQQRNEVTKRLHDFLQSKPRQESLSLPLIRSSDTDVQAYSFEDIKAATCNFSQHFKIGEATYKGEIKEKTVVIKLVKDESIECLREFQHEIDLMQRFRHPHLVRIVGACFERGCIVYEHMTKGSLHDHLPSKYGFQPIPWHVRVRIATEVCTALAALHNARPNPIVHCHLQLKHILLDENFVCKIRGLGLSPQMMTEDGSFQEFKNSFPHIDPESRLTGTFTIKSDVYSFGLILLQLLTGRQSLNGLVTEVEKDLNKEKFKQLLDPSAEWPEIHATELAYLALSCVEENGKNRPDLQPTVIRILERLRISAGSSTTHEIKNPSTKIGETEHTRAVGVFFCPILQEIMHNPYIAADGFTYEYEAIKGWLDGGHDTSPMTNLKLSHRNLVPNHALRSAIRQWQEDVGYCL